MMAMQYTFLGTDYERIQLFVKGFVLLLLSKYMYISS